MSMYIHFDGEAEGVQVASLGGWGDFCRWVGQSGISVSAPLVQLVQTGTCVDPIGLARAIKELLTVHPPIAPGVLSTAMGIRKLLEVSRAAHSVGISQGLGA